MRKAFIVAVLVLSSGCGGSDPKRAVGGACELNSECAAPLVCRLGSCRVECNTTRDCPTRLACVRDSPTPGEGFGVCQLPSEHGCALASDCPAPLVCRSTQCVNECAEQRDCPPGAECLFTPEGLACIDQFLDESCVRDSECTAPMRCAVDGRCRHECLTDRDCRFETFCDPFDRSCKLASEFIDGGPPDFDGGGVDGGGVDGGVSCAPFVPPPPPVGGAGCFGGMGAVAIGVGLEFGCAVLSDGTVACWGSNFYGTLGTTTTDRTNPVPVIVDGITTAIDVEVSTETTCALLADRSTVCWGNNQAAQVGDGTMDMSHMTATAPAGLGPVRSIRPGSAHNCAVDLAGDAFCWGFGGNGELGDGSIAARFVTRPQRVPGLSCLDSIIAGVSTSCAIGGGRLWCWGWNNTGVAGTGTMMAEPSPAEVVGLTARLVDNDVDHTCALDTSGATWCWGRDTNGALGNGPGASAPAYVPAAVATAMTARDLQVGYQYVCLLTTTGAVQCWGLNDWGQLGLGDTTQRDAPGATVMGLPGGRPVDEISAGSSHACARVGGDVYCWGRNFDGAIGQPYPGVPSMPTAVQVCIP